MRHIDFQRRVRLLRPLWLVVALLVCVVLYLAHEYSANTRLMPPSAHATIVEVAEVVPAPIRIALVSHNGMQRMVWIGQIPPLTIRSGPPCYVFDERGELIDWRPATGEGWQLDSLVTMAFQNRPLSVEDAVKWCESHKVLGHSGREAHHPASQ